MQFTAKFALLAVAVTYGTVSVAALPIYHRYDARAVVADIPPRDLDSPLAFVARDFQSLFERGGEGSVPGSSKKPPRKGQKRANPASSEKADNKSKKPKKQPQAEIWSSQQSTFQVEGYVFQDPTSNTLPSSSHESGPEEQLPQQLPQDFSHYPGSAFEASKQKEPEPPAKKQKKSPAKKQKEPPAK